MQSSRGRLHSKHFIRLIVLVRTSPLNARLAFFNSMTTHFFDTDDAVKYGATEAIILANIRYWRTNVSNGLFRIRYRHKRCTTK